MEKITINNLKSRRSAVGGRRFNITQINKVGGRRSAVNITQINTMKLN